MNGTHARKRPRCLDCRRPARTWALCRDCKANRALIAEALAPPPKVPEREARMELHRRRWAPLGEMGYGEG